jgi:hypothetical protein
MKTSVKLGDFQIQSKEEFIETNYNLSTINQKQNILKAASDFYAD